MCSLNCDQLKSPNSSKNYSEIIQEIFMSRETIKLKIMEEKPQKLALNEKLTILNKSPNEILHDQLLKSGKLSISWVMRKLKCDEQSAREYIIQVTRHECEDWDFLEIDMFDLEWECCLCFRR